MRAFDDTYFETLDRPVKLRLCDHGQCGQAGDYKAPKSRDHLTDYYFFCLDHVREYNKAWDFFSGLTPEEIEDYTRDAVVWERPSWPLGHWGINEQKLRAKAMHDIFGEAPHQEANSNTPPTVSAEREALATLELVPPVEFSTIKAQYRHLVKKHHPDLHGGNKENEEKFKSISHAFATIRRFYVNISE